MRSLVLGLALLVLAAAPAHAERAWSEPVFAGATSGALAPDGTAVVGAYTGTAAVAQVGDGPAATFDGGGPPLVATAGGGRGAVAFTDADGLLHAAVAEDGTFGAATRLGRGMVVDVAANARGDVAVLGLDGTGRPLLAVRSAGRGFGALQALDGPPRASVLVLPGGQAVTDPVHLTGGAIASLAADGQGRVLAAWADGDTVRTAVRPALGDWTAPATHPVPATPGRVQAGTSRSGDAVLAWRSRGAPGDLLAMTGTIGDQSFSAPVILDDHDGGAPALAVGADGSALVASADDELAVRVVRREGTGPFGPSQIVTCLEQPAPLAAGLDGAGNALLVAAPFLLRDALAPVPAPEPTCGLGDPRALYSLERVVTGVPVAITVLGLGAPVHLVRTFDRPGRIRWTHAGHRFTVKVFRPARIRARRDGDAIRVRANAFAASGRARVQIQLRRAGRIVARRALRLGARPRTVRLPAPAGRLRAVLRQGDRVEARARVRAG